MPITISKVTAADWGRACAIHFDAMGHDHVFVDEGFPRHTTTTGRRAALERHRALGGPHADPNMHHIKLMDDSLTEVQAETLGTASCEPFIGYGRWLIKRAGTDMSFLAKSPDLGDWWPAERDKRFVAWSTHEYFSRRHQMLMQLPVNQSLYCVDMLAVLPGFQGRGAGEAFLKWGMDQADRDGALCTVESALGAESFYAKFGFVVLEHVAFTPPPEFADKGTQEVKWMVRHPRPL